uniref:MinD/ParA family protein n=1 Tax=Desulfobacca acetoxidans TaxID=60893 RepID=A0A7C3Z7C8_9BACT
MAEPKLWSITSGKGGVGKTCLAVNLAFALAHQGKHVLLVDGDLGLANVDVLLGLEVKTNLRNVLDQGADPSATLVRVHPLVEVLPASSGVPEMANLGPEEQALLGEVLRTMAATFDHVLVDTAAGLGSSVLWFNTLVDYSLVVLTPDPTALTDAYALIKVLSRESQGRRYLVILNNVQGEREARYTFDILAQAAARFLNLDLEYLGAVPTDPAVIQALRARVPFLEQYPQSPASQALQDIAARMIRLSQGWPPPQPPETRIPAR